MNHLDAACHFVHSLRLADVPDEALSRARLALLDTTGVMIAASTEPRVQKLTSILRRRNSSGRSTFVTDGLGGNSVDAALVNAVCACLNVEDESHKLAWGHPATYVFPSALAVAEEIGASGEETLLAFLAAYEVTVRLGIAWGWSRKNMHPSGVYGPIGGASGVARLLRFAPDQMRMAMNLAAPLTSASSWQAGVEGATVRDLYSGQGAMLAVQAPLWVDAGFTGARDDVANVLGNISGTAFNAAALSDGLGTVWEIARNAYKIHACCGNVMSGIEAAIDLQARERFKSEDIVGIQVDTYRNPATLNTNPEPINVLSAKESFPVSLALAFTYGNCGRGVYTEQNVSNPEVRRLASIARIQLDPALDALTPMKRPSRVTVILRDGRELVGYSEAPIDTAPPLDAIHAKFESTVAPVIGSEAASRLKRAIDNFSNLRTVSELTRIIRPPH